MAATFIALPMLTPPTESSPRFPAAITFNSRRAVSFDTVSSKLNMRRTGRVGVSAIGGDPKVPNANYVVPMDISSSSITRPLVEILRDLNKRITDNIIVKQSESNQSSFIPWYHANRMLSFYAPGWCGEIRDVIFSDTGSVTVVFRVTVRGSDGEAFTRNLECVLIQAHREATGTVTSASSVENVDPVAAAEEIAFCKACARFGLGLYLYHED